MKRTRHPLRLWLIGRQETQAEFADRIGISGPFLSDIIHGKRRPSLNTLDAISVGTNGAITANHFQHVNGRKMK